MKGEKCAMSSENRRRQVLEELWELADAKFQEFNRSLVPGEGSQMIGVRIPKLRELAKRIAKTEPEEYLASLRTVDRNELFHEERLLYGMTVGYLKCGISRRQELLDGFVPLIDSWAVCDSCCTTYKFMKKDQEVWFAYLQKYLESGREYDLRFALVCLLAHFINETYIDRVLDICRRTSHEGYYVKMAAAWLVSVCYVKFPEKTRRLIEENQMDDFTHNKAIQKIRESYRVSREEKDELNRLKR